MIFSTGLILFSSCASKVPVPYDRVLRSIDAAYVHPDKDKMEAAYKGYMDELFTVIKELEQKCSLKPDK